MTLRETRGFFARCLLSQGSTEETVSIGSIVLRPHQQSAIKRAKAAIDEFGGALLSDHVGTGKTYVALALAARHGSATVIGPAVLREMWTNAASRAQVQISFISTESLSRMAPAGRERNAAGSTPLVIVDEAQHFRNSATRRFASLAHLCSGRQVFLLSATPIHNRQHDLEALLSLFVGSRATNLSQSEMGRIVIRRRRDEIGESAPMPRVAAPEWCDLTHDDEIPQLLLSLPPPLSPRNGGDGGALVVHSLIRQWISSDAALYRALIRRLQKATALVSALESGAYPSDPELAAWISGEDCVQLGFAELLSTANSDSANLLLIVRRHMAAIQTLTQRLKLSKRRDLERAGLIRDIRGRHIGVGIVAFSQYADTVEGLFELLAPDGSAAVLTGAGARVSGGRISRAEAIGRFAPHASGRKSPRTADAVTLLLTTDILSEGVNLQDAAVVIHLDLPWTPARMEQRLGRVARMGSRHTRVFSYVMRPPASADSLIRTERTLRTKMVSAGMVTDGLQSILPGPFQALPGESIPTVIEDLRSILGEWSTDATEHASSELKVSAIAAPVNGFIALRHTAGRYGLIVSDSRGITDDPARMLSMMRLATTDEIDVSLTEISQSVEAARRYLRAGRAVGSDRSQAHRGQTSRRNALRRIAHIASSARPHERWHILPASAHARAIVLGRLSAWQETQLTSLADERLPDDEWLGRVTVLSANARLDTDADEIVAMILFRSTAL